MGPRSRVNRTALFGPLSFSPLDYNHPLVQVNKQLHEKQLGHHSYPSVLSSHFLYGGPIRRFTFLFYPYLCRGWSLIFLFEVGGFALSERIPPPHSPNVESVVSRVAAAGVPDFAGRFYLIDPRPCEKFSSFPPPPEN